MSNMSVKSRLLWSMKHAMNNRNTNLYQVHVKSIRLGQLSLDMASESNLMVDCGSTTSYMKGSFYKPILEVVSTIYIS